MPLDPAAPQSLPDLVDAFEQTVRAVIDLGRGCGEDELARSTDCPGWTVQDQLAHVVGVEAWLEGRQDPRVQLPQYDHIRNDLGKRVEYAVEVRRGHTGAEVVAELEEVLAQRLSTLRDPVLTATSIIPGPFGPEQAAMVVAMRTFDVWTHEQDIRAALSRPGNLDSAAAAVFVSLVITQLPRLVAKGAALEPGHEVVIDVSGPGLAATTGIRVVMDEHGRPRGQAMPDGELQQRTSDSTTTTTISLSAEAFTRRAAGRRSVGETAYSVVGDDAVARRVLEALVVTH